jgi:hypothetical protein
LAVSLLRWRPLTIAKPALALAVVCLDRCRVEPPTLPALTRGVPEPSPPKLALVPDVRTAPSGVHSPPTQPQAAGSGEQHPSRRGRPPGSVSLTPEIQERIVSLIRAGVFDHVAAQTAGIAPRTFYDWVARGEDRHPSRPPTRKLRAFAVAVRTAQAEARAVAESRVFQERPALWLSRAARTASDLPGWTEPKEEPATEGTLEDWIRRLDEEGEAEAIRASREGCSVENCQCPLHEEEENHEPYIPETD